MEYGPEACGTRILERDGQPLVACIEISYLLMLIEFTTRVTP